MKLLLSTLRPALRGPDQPIDRSLQEATLCRWVHALDQVDDSLLLVDPSGYIAHIFS
jgi:hypothetical protein